MNQDQHIILDKELRRDIDAIIQRLKSAMSGSFGCQTLGNASLAVDMSKPQQFGRWSEERKDALKSLQLAVMWLGMDLKAINEENPGAIENPYPNSKNPSNTVIDKTADGLKL